MEKTQLIKVPGYDDPVAFPADMSDQEIAKAIQRNSIKNERVPEISQAPSKFQQFLDSEPVAVADQAIRGGALMLPKLLDLATSPARWAGKKLSDKTLEAVGMEPAEEVPAKNALVDALSFGQVPEGNALHKLASLEKPGEVLEEVTGGPVRKPSTTTGQYLGTMGENVVGTVAGPFRAATLPRTLTIAAGSGAGSEAAAQMSDNPLARLAGGLVGGGLTAAGASRIKNSNTLIKDATKYVPDADWALARGMKKELTKANVPHLNSQLLGPSSSLDDVVSKAASNPEVRPKFLNFLRASPKRARQWIDTWLDSTTEPGVSSTRKTLDEVQEEATQYIQGLKGKANEVYTNALKEGVSYEQYSKQYIETLKEELESLMYKADKYGPTGPHADFIRSVVKDLKDPETGKLFTVKGYVNAVYKNLNTIAKGTGPEGYKGAALKDVKRILKDFTPEYEDAREAKRLFMQDTVSPVQKGLVGDIASAGGGMRPDKTTIRKSIINAVFPADQDLSKEILEMGRTLGDQSVSKITREHLARSLNNAMKVKGTAKDLVTPYGFVQSIAGTHAQQKNLGAALRVIAEGQGKNPRAVQQGAFKMFKSLDSFKDLKIPASIDKGELQQEAGRNVAGMMAALMSRWSRWTESITSTKAYNEVADIVMSPGGLDTLEKIAKSKDPQTIATLTYNLLISAQGGGEETPPN